MNRQQRLVGSQQRPLQSRERADRADVAEVGCDSGSLSVDAVALRALRLGVEQRAAARRVADAP
jgi:hypothetical protein